MPKISRTRSSKLPLQWRSQLRHGFSILLYGPGSKKDALDRLAEELHDGPVITVRGFVPELQIGQVLVPLAACLKQESFQRVCVHIRSEGQRMSVREKRRLLDEIDSASGQGTVYLVIHAIDSPSMRTSDWRKALQRIAACERVRVMATADSILSPALFSTESWNHKFNFWPHYVATGVLFSAEELAVLPQIQSSKSWVASSSQSAEVVLRSLTKNGRDVFRVVCECQLDQLREHEKAKEEEKDKRPAVMHEKASSLALDLGLTVPELYRRCRLKFLVTNETALQAHVREYKDHGLIRGRRKADGSEALHIPLPEDSLHALLEKLKSWED